MAAAGKSWHLGNMHGYLDGKEGKAYNPRKTDDPMGYEQGYEEGMVERLKASSGAGPSRHKKSQSKHRAKWYEKPAAAKPKKAKKISPKSALAKYITGGIDDADMKKRYRALALIYHPDKCPEAKSELIDQYNLPIPKDNDECTEIFKLLVELRDEYGF